MITKQATHPGVYAVMASGLVEVSQYGTATIDLFTQEIRFNFNQGIPQVAVPLGFAVYLPDTVMAEAKVYLLPSMEAGHWHRNLVVAGDAKPISSSADKVSGSVYKVIPDLPSGATGFLCLLVKMPAGSDDRLYAIHLK